MKVVLAKHYSCNTVSVDFTTDFESWQYHDNVQQ